MARDIVDAVTDEVLKRLSDGLPSHGQGALCPVSMKLDEVWARLVAAFNVVQPCGSIDLHGRIFPCALRKPGFATQLVEKPFSARNAAGDGHGRLVVG